MKTKAKNWFYFWLLILLLGCSKSPDMDMRAEFARTFSSLNPPSPIELVTRIECWKLRALPRSSAIPNDIAEAAVLIYAAESADARLRAKSIHEALLREETKYPDAPAKDEYVLFVHRNDGMKIAFRVITHARDGMLCGAEFIVLDSSVRHIDNAGIHDILF